MIPGALAPWPEEFEFDRPEDDDAPCPQRQWSDTSGELYEGESTTPGYEGDA